MTTPTKVHQDVQKEYGEYARKNTSCCGPENKLYSPEVIKDIPADIANFSAGSGNPVTPAKLKPGETVLDLGSGGGLDCFLAARLVGEKGHVIGVDMTPEMLEKARGNALRLGTTNVEFREGYLEALPVESNTIDVVISNCVVNLSPDKPMVLSEIFRVLKPGGRLCLSDIVTNRPVSQEHQQDSQEWCGCISGALPAQEYREELEKVGFMNIELTPDIEVARQAIEAGQFQAPPGVKKENVLKVLDTWDQGEANIFMPHLIEARKPK
jgi:arsenite methyltransferase